MVHLSLALLGPMEVRLDERPITDFESGRVRALLAYLAVEAGRPHPRESVAELLWPGWPAVSAQSNLRHALSSLRRTIGDARTTPPFLLISRELLAFDPHSDHDLDTATFARLVSAARAAPEQAERLERAVALYRGPFLEGPLVTDSAAFEAWALQWREHYAREVQTALEWLTRHYTERGECGVAEGHARRHLALDPLSEAAQRHLMRILAQSGRRNEALAQYERCREVLAQELGVEPEVETTALYEAIHQGALGSAKPRTPVVVGSEERGEGGGERLTRGATETVLPLLHQLPPSPPDFAGRKGELRALLDAVQGEGARILGVRGLGGVGKTTQALRLGERLAEHYPDAQFYIEMRGMDAQPLAAAEAMAQVIHAYYPLAQLPQGEAALGALYRSVLQGQRALLLLDNARDRAQVEPLLPPASCLLVLTSRWRFALPGLRALDLGAQSPEEAAQLLRAVAPRLGEQEAQALAQACGGLPLALRVAGSALAEWEDLPVEEYLAQLRAAQEGLPEELQEVEASLALSDALLSAALRARWYALAVFPETFERGGAQAVWGLASAMEAQGALGELLRYNLVEYDPQGRRYRLHDLCRAYTAARLGAEAEEQARARHAAHYAQVLQETDRQYEQSEYGPAQLALFDRERANILGGQAWAAAQAERSAEAARRCLAYAPAALEGVFQFMPMYPLSARLYAQQRVAWWEATLRAARQAGDRVAELRCLLMLANAHQDLGQILPMREEARRALAIARALGERRGEGIALWLVANACSKLEGPGGAVTYYEQSLAIAREVGWPTLEVAIHERLATLYLELEQPRRALDYVQRGLAIARERQPVSSSPFLLLASGRVHVELGDPRRGLEDIEAALALQRERGVRHDEGFALLYAGRAYHALGELARAQEHFERALAIGHETDHRDLTAQVLDQLGQLCAAQGAARRALAYDEQALRAWGEVGKVLGQAGTLWNMSLALDALGERARAIVAAQKALALYTQMEHPAAERVRQRLTQWAKG